VESGFSGGFVNNPSYRDVCTKNTGHAEVVQIIFNPNQVSLEEILKIFFYSHDPTSINKQGDDIGDQYRSIAFYRNKYQFQVLNAMIVALNRSNVFSNSIQTKIEQFKVFFKAEEYHQGYYEYNRETPYCKKIIQPKIQKIEIDFKKNIKN
jgi:methionine-S-sulfoxide reductase